MFSVIWSLDLTATSTCFMTYVVWQWICVWAEFRGK
jgi:hypothetical protein